MVGLVVDILEGAPGAAAAASLRHAVFVCEMGASPDAEDDAYDARATHVLLRDGTRADPAVVGALRLAQGTTYTERAFDLTALRSQGRAIAEIGRLCLHPEYRGGLAGAMLLAAAVERLRGRGVELIVGAASLFGTDAARHMPVLRALRDAALAPAEIRPVARPGRAVAVDGADTADARYLPPLLKTYLRAGAWVGEDAAIDRGFNCVDVCVVLDLARVALPARLQGLGAG